MKRVKYTKNDYEEFLDELSPPYDSPEWIIGGINRRGEYAPGRYGAAIRRHDPIAFAVGYGEMEREREFQRERELRRG